MARATRSTRLAITMLLASALTSGCEGAPAWDTDGNALASGDGAAATTTPLPLPEPVATRSLETPRIALANFLAAQNIAETPPHRDARTDLDGDGSDDLVMLLEGRNWCDSGGCTLLVFHRDDGARDDGADYRLVTRTRLTNAPIRISSQTHNGWHDLLVGVGGAGTRRGTVALQFNGSSYPSNPTLLATLADSALPQSRVLID